MRRDRLIGIGLLLFAGMAAFLTSRLPDSTMPEEPGPKFFPYVVLAVLAFLSLLLTLGMGRNKKDPLPKESMRLEANQSFSEALMFYGVFLLGLCLMPVLGFVLSMISVVTAMLKLGGWKLFPKALCFSAVVTVIVYLLFDRLMEIVLPGGMLFPS